MLPLAVYSVQCTVYSICANIYAVSFALMPPKKKKKTKWKKRISNSTQMELLNSAMLRKKEGKNNLRRIEMKVVDNWFQFNIIIFDDNFTAHVHRLTSNVKIKKNI